MSDRFLYKSTFGRIVLIAGSSVSFVVVFWLFFPTQQARFTPAYAGSQQESAGSDPVPADSLTHTESGQMTSDLIVADSSVTRQRLFEQQLKKIEETNSALVYRETWDSFPNGSMPTTRFLDPQGGIYSQDDTGPRIYNGISTHVMPVPAEGDYLTARSEWRYNYAPDANSKQLQPFRKYTLKFKIRFRTLPDYGVNVMVAQILFPRTGIREYAHGSPVATYSELPAHAPNYTLYHVTDVNKDYWHHDKNPSYWEVATMGEKSPTLGLEVCAGKWKMHMNASSVLVDDPGDISRFNWYNLGNVVKDKWINVEIQVVGDHRGDGYISLKLDNEEKLVYHGRVGHIDPNFSYFKNGIYIPDWNDEKGVAKGMDYARAMNEEKEVRVEIDDVVIQSGASSTIHNSPNNKQMMWAISNAYYSRFNVPENFFDHFKPISILAWCSPYPKQHLITKGDDGHTTFDIQFSSSTVMVRICSDSISGDRYEAEFAYTDFGNNRTNKNEMQLLAFTWDGTDDDGIGFIQNGRSVAALKSFTKGVPRSDNNGFWSTRYAPQNVCYAGYLGMVYFVDKVVSTTEVRKIYIKGQYADPATLTLYTQGNISHYTANDGTPLNGDQVVKNRPAIGPRFHSHIQQGLYYSSFIEPPLAGNIDGFSVRTDSDNEVKLDWEVTSDADGYHVQRKALTDTQYANIATTRASNYTDVTAVKGTSYLYRVRAYEDNPAAPFGNLGGWTDPITIIPGESAPH